MSDEPGLPEPVRLWIQAEADRHFGGDFGRAAAAILEAAWAAEQEPRDPWAGLDKRLEKRRGI